MTRTRFVMWWTGAVLFFGVSLVTAWDALATAYHLQQKQKADL